MHSPRRQLLLVVALGAGICSGLVFGCDSENESTAVPTEDASRHRDPSANCVKPGTKNNEQGIGGYCETNADCVEGKSLCSGLFGAPDNAWFCTRLCNDDPNCGEGLYCARDSRGVACVPLVCGVADGGTDADAP